MLDVETQISGPNSHRRPALPRLRRRLATTALLIALAVALLAAIPGLQGVLREIRHLGPGWIAVGVALELASDISFVVVFRLFFDRLERGDARLLGWVEQGSGALLPGGGAGGLAIGGWLIHLTGVPVHWIARRSGGLFFLGAATSGLALVGSGVALIAGAPGPDGVVTVVLPTTLAAIVFALIAALPGLVRTRPRTPRWIAAIASGVDDARQVALGGRPSWRLLGAAGYLAFDIAVLWVFLDALGPAPSIAAVIFAYSVGYAANSLPVPGGIGVLDAGLTGALVLYGISPVHAAAAAIVYHAVAFWVPGLGGIAAYARLRPRLLRASHADAELRLTPEPIASEEAHDALTPSDTSANPPRLGDHAHRWPRIGPVPRTVRTAASAALPGDDDVSGQKEMAA
jgi:uncharacterized membrane protein YbhN (UPF0104 family)